MKKTKISAIIILSLVLLFGRITAFAQNNPRKIVSRPDKTINQNGDQIQTLNTYMIKLPHTRENCLSTLETFSADSPEFLNEIEWGCMSGDHTGYMIVQGKNEVAAMQMIPAFFRSNAKIEKLDKFTAEEIKALHQQN